MQQEGTENKENKERGGEGKRKEVRLVGFARLKKDPKLSFREPLNNSSLNYSETGKKKRGFSFPHIFKDLSVLKMAAHPWAAGKSELIRLSLKKKV